MKSFIKHDFISKSFNKIYRRNLHSPQISKFPKKIYLKSFLVGILSGGLGSLVGMGGGFIAVPVLSNHFGLSQVISNGTSLFAVFSTSIGGSFSYLMRENFDFSKFKKELFNKKMGDIHFPSAIGISISSSLTVIIASKYSKSIKSNILKLYSGIFMISIAPLVLLRSNLLNSQRYIDESLKIGSNNEKSETMYFLPVLIGSISGLIAGMFGVGGGAITVPALCLFTNTDYQTALGTSLAAMVPTSLLGAITHLLQGTMNLRIGIPLSLGCLIGSLLGGKYGSNIKDNNLKLIFASVVTLVGARTIWIARKL